MTKNKQDQQQRAGAVTWCACSEHLAAVAAAMWQQYNCLWHGVPLPLPSSPGKGPIGERLPPDDLERSPRRDHGACQVEWQARSPMPNKNISLIHEVIPARRPAPFSAQARYYTTLYYTIHCTLYAIHYTPYAIPNRHATNKSPQRTTLQRKLKHHSTRGK